MAGGILGGTVGYWIGRSVSSEFLRKYGKWIGLTENRLALGRHLFQSHGGKIVFFGRFIAVLRIVAALLAGLNQYDFKRFFLFNAAGVVAWAAIMGLGGYFFGDAMTRVSGPLGAIGLAFAAAVVVGFLIVLRRQEKNSNRNSPKMPSRKTAK
ncbi:MAG: DedA family protein [Methylovirgula sp.]